MPAMVRALVAVTPDSLKPACRATATSFWALLISRHSAARMKGSNLKISFDPAGSNDQLNEGASWINVLAPERTHGPGHSSKHTSHAAYKDR